MILDAEKLRDRLPRVTDIIAAANITPRYKEGDYLAIGTAVDIGCRFLFQGHKLADLESVDGRVMPYLISLELWLHATGFKAEAIQPEYTSKRHGYICHPDVLDGNVWLLDSKTGGKYKWHRLQTISYKVAANEQDDRVWVQRRGSLYLQKDGSIAKLDEHRPEDDSADWNAFLSAKRLYDANLELDRYRQNLKTWMEN
jgi:hypothetical protein